MTKHQKFVAAVLAMGGPAALAHAGMADSVAAIELEMTTGIGLIAAAIGTIGVAALVFFGARFALRKLKGIMSAGA